MQKIILGVAGEIATGKGTVSEYLIKKHGASSYRFSTALRDIAKRMHLEESRENLQKLSSLMRDNFYDNILSKVIYEDMKNDSNQIICIDGVRRMADIEFLKKIPEFKILFVETDMKNRYERIIKRGENIDDNTKTLDEFRRDHKREAEIQVKYLKDEADFVVDNNGTFEDLYVQIDKIVESQK